MQLIPATIPFPSCQGSALAIAGCRYSRSVGLFKTRREQAGLAAREAAGEYFWTSEFREAARNKIVMAMWDANGPWAEVTYETPLENAKKLLAREFGWHHLERLDGKAALSRLSSKSRTGRSWRPLLRQSSGL